MNQNEKKALRKKLFVNREVQGAIILRSILLWCFYMCAILLTVVVWTALVDPSELPIKLVFKSFVYFSPAIIASIFLLPLFIFDVLKSSHRFAGPILRLKREMKKIANGEDVGNLRFRDGDDWSDLSAAFNELATTIREERQAAANQETSNEEAVAV